MSKTHRLFRYIWRVNAVLILVAAGAITFAVLTLLVAEWQGSSAQRREGAVGPPVAGPSADSRLYLGRAELVGGTHVMRVDLYLPREGSGFSSGGYAETRNLLFIDPGDPGARWLLPDDDRVIVEQSDITVEEEGASERRVVATAALVKAASANRQVDPGTLFLFDPAGKTVVEAADGVRELQLTTLAPAGTLRILYEREQRLFIAEFDAESLTKESEHVMEVPLLD